MTDFELEEILGDYLEEAVSMMEDADLLDLLPENITVTLYNRYRGRTIAKTLCYVEYEEFEIRICKKYFQRWVEEVDREAILDTLLHEFCHTLPLSMNHGKWWKKYVGILNRKYGLKISRFG